MRTSSSRKADNKHFPDLGSLTETLSSCYEEAPQAPALEVTRVTADGKLAAVSSMARPWLEHELLKEEAVRALKEHNRK